MAALVGTLANLAPPLQPHEFAVGPMFPGEEGLAGRVDTNVTPLALKVVMVVLFAFLAILMLMTTVYQCCFAANPETNSGGSGAGRSVQHGRPSGPHETIEAYKASEADEASEADKASEASEAGESDQATDPNKVGNPDTFHEESPRAKSPNGEVGAESPNREVGSDGESS